MKKLSLITRNESEFSSCVTKEEADMFLKITDQDKTAKTANKVADKIKDDFDLLD